MNLTPFPDPNVPGDPIPGEAVPLSWIPEPFAKELCSQVATGGRFSFDPNMSPLDLFSSWHPNTGDGVAVIILNSLTTPLTLVDSFEDSGGYPQMSYPAVIDAATQKVVRAHEIPGVRLYPRPSLHKGPNGAPAQLGAVGLYRFWASAGIRNGAGRAMAFSCQPENPSKSDVPLLGVAFDYSHDFFTNKPTLVMAVSADVSQQGGLQALWTAAKTRATPQPYDVGTGTNRLTIWGIGAPGTPTIEQGTRTLIVWVRDTASTFG